jgi:CBS domain-containing protein
MLDVVRFLSAHPPFAGLDANALERVAQSIRVEYFVPGTVVIEQGGSPSAFVYVVRKGRVELVDIERVVDVLEEGELFGFPSLLSGEPPGYTVRVAEETICYLIEGEVARTVFAIPDGMRFLTVALRQRAGFVAEASGERTVIRNVARGHLVSASPDTTIRRVAELLTERSATAAVVLIDGRIGIVTDRDIRAQVVAGSVSPDEAVETIATVPARTVGPDELVDAALVRMLQLGVHHLPLVEDGVVKGMLTDIDLLGHQRRDAFRLRSEIGRAPDVEAVAEAGLRVPDALAPLIRVGMDADHVGVVMAALQDAMVSRLLDLYIAEHGEFPAPFAWIALGSGGRREQGLVTDQDHALVYGDGAEDSDESYRSLAEFVVEGLERAGVSRCTSKVMASEDGWRGSTSWWRSRIADWMGIPEDKAAFLTGLTFDGRRVAGDLDIEPLFAGAVELASADHAFINRLIHLLAEVKVPVGFLGGLVMTDDGEHSGLDVKHGGVLPVTEIARIFALRAGSRATGTVRRLAAAAEAGLIGRNVADGLEEAYRLFRDLRVRHQLEGRENRRPPDELLDPVELGPLERRALRDAFRLVREVQKDLLASAAPRVLGR